MSEKCFIKERVSVITPVYNGEQYLSGMLDSVLAQTYSDIEMILVDDGSTDHTAEVAETYQKKFERKGYRFHFVLSEHKNASAAINHGLPYVTGEYLIWPDSDDRLEPESVAKRVAFLKNHLEYGAVRSLSYYLDAKNGERTKADERRGNLDNEKIFWDILNARTFVCCGCYMLRSEAFFDIYPERCIPVSDVGQNFQMLLPFMYHYRCYTIREELYGVTVRAGSHSRTYLTREQEIKKLQDYEILVDTIADICQIHDKESKKRILSWKMEQRYRFSEKYRDKKLASSCLCYLWKEKRISFFKLIKREFMIHVENEKIRKIAYNCNLAVSRLIGKD